MQAKNKIIVVTGAGNGMGREITLNLLAKGAKVAAVDMNETALQETKKIAGEWASNLSLHVLNITDRAAVAAFPNQVISTHGNVDGLINDAGIIQPFMKINDLDFAHITRVMDVNFYGTLNMTKAFLPFLLKRPEAHIVNVSSMGGFLPVPGQSIYGASKAAVKLLTEGLRAELLDTNIKVTVIFPGAIGTNIAANSGISDMPKMTDADMEKAKTKTTSPVKAAQMIVDGMEKNKERVFVGNDSLMMDILYRLNPVGAANMINKQMKSLLKKG
jgi:short-subunit dehydrogenase